MKGSQPTLFDCEPRPISQYGYEIPAAESTPPLARRTDPSTSQTAAARVAPELSELEALFVQTLARFEIPATAQEVADKAIAIEPGVNVRAALAKRESIRKRAGELTRSKFDKSGRLIRSAAIRGVGERPCLVTGNKATVYEVIR